MRLLAALAGLMLLACAVLAANANKPLTMRIDDNSPGHWVRFAAAPTTVPSKPELVCMYAFVPGSLGKSITET